VPEILKKAGLDKTLENVARSELLDQVNVSDPINQDPNPELIQRELSEPVVVNQNYKVRYLQPAPIRTPSPNVILERQSTPLPPLAPVRVRQFVPNKRTQTPLLIREKEPPQKPQSKNCSIATHFNKVLKK
jgi:hypothetical protein